MDFTGQSGAGTALGDYGEM